MGRIVKDWEELGRALDGERRKGRKLVFTNGCFDLLHAGHVRYLREAKKLGDILVVGLNSDRSVSEIKPERPITPEDQRAEVVSSLEMVDYVTFFDEATPYEIIRKIMPDVLVKGGDWRPEDIVGSDIAAQTRSLPYYEGLSTTDIIRKIRNMRKG
ncbi:MAG: adenylyltransferase/cytidyltransferase family protein [Nitrospirota bacterium]|jgi:rfaE bifunctional protein nucleotidyltransferase chain/domain